MAAPFIGPVLDRVKGGRRWMIVAAIGLRAVLCVLIVRDLNSVAFYFEAFLMLVFQKAYLISRAARGAHHRAQRPRAGRGQLQAGPAERHGRHRRPVAPACSC